jgi:(p)ppGpp synthase/HD superfamily hydrolase
VTEGHELDEVPGAEEAVVFAAAAYRTRLKRAGRGIEHPIAVARLLADDGQPPPLVVAGVLHDLLEDTDVSSGELQATFGPEVARLVNTLTQDPSIAGYRKRKAALRRQILDGGADAATVSVGDKLAKLRSRDERPAERKLHHYRRTLQAVEERYGTSRLTALLGGELARWTDAVGEDPTRGDARAGPPRR